MGMESEAMGKILFHFHFHSLSFIQLGDASPFLFNWENQKSEKKKEKPKLFHSCFAFVFRSAIRV